MYRIICASSQPLSRLGDGTRRGVPMSAALTDLFASPVQTLLARLGTTIPGSSRGHTLVAKDLIQSLPIDPSNPETIRETARRFHKDGLVVLGDVLKPSEIHSLRQGYQERWQEFSQVLRERKMDLDPPMCFAFAECCHRSQQRYDFRYRMAEEPFLSLARHPSWYPLVQALFSGDARVATFGVINSRPGSIEQIMHVDGQHHFEAELPDSVQLPPSVVTLFIPLVDLKEELGPTEFWPGTHTRRGQQACVEGSGSVSPLVPAGSALLFDYRIVHRGMANVAATQDRPVLYFTYARSWWREDALAHESIFSDGHNPKCDLRQRLRFFGEDYGS